MRFDKWDLKTGHDKFSFMEKMVNDKSVNKVLIICDKGYKEKADNRAGGVGTETQILTPKIYDNISQEKFIPIIAERDDDGNSYIPSFIGTRMYRDLSNDDTFEVEYEKLLRDIYDKPKYQRPALGTRPMFLDEEADISFSKLNGLLRKIEKATESNPSRLAPLIMDYKNTFYEIMDEFSIEDSDIKTEISIDELVYKKIEEMKPLRDNFISFIKNAQEGTALDSDYFIDFFEGIVKFTDFRESGTYHEMQFDHYKFIIYELFLHLTSNLVNTKNFNMLAHILDTDYEFQTDFLKGRDMTFDYLNFHVKSLEFRNKRLERSSKSLQVDILMKRCQKNEKKELYEADALLFNVTSLGNLQSSNWDPKIAVREEFSRERIKLFKKLISKKYFEQVKKIFLIETKEEFVKRVMEQEQVRVHFHYLPIIRFSINPDKICTKD